MALKYASAIIVLLLTSVPVVPVIAVGADEESIAAARELYSAANYDEALLMLNKLRVGPQTSDSQMAIEQYRAFCLLALGRQSEAQQAIEAVVMAQPSYTPSDDEVSPRIRTAFSDVRKRMLPAIIQEKYARAKAAFDRKDHAIAALEFQQVLASMSDPDVAMAVSKPPLSDVRTLATGFYELSMAAAFPPTPPPPPAAPEPPVETVVEAAPPPAVITPAPAPTPAVTAAAAPAASVSAPPVAAFATPAAPSATAPRAYPYGPEDLGVLAPVVVKQSLPDFDASLGKTFRPGVLEVVIDENGNVESAMMRVPVNPKYDPAVIAAAKNWKYKPATFQGKPVRYRKMMTISVR